MRVKKFVITVLLSFLLSPQASAFEKREIEILFDILRKGDNLERIDASEKLVKMGTVVGDVLIKHLKEDSENMRKSIVWVLGEIGEKRSVRHIIPLLGSSRELTRFVLVALGKIGDPQTIPIIAKKAKDKSREIRTDAVRAFGRIGDKRAIPYLVEAKSDTDWHIREAAAKSFSEIGGPGALEHLEDLAENDPDGVVRAWAYEGLQKNYYRQ